MKKRNVVANYEVYDCSVDASHTLFKYEWYLGAYHCAKRMYQENPDHLIILVDKVNHTRYYVNENGELKIIREEAK